MGDLAAGKSTHIIEPPYLVLTYPKRRQTSLLQNSAEDLSKEHEETKNSKNVPVQRARAADGRMTKLSNFSSW